MVVECAYHVKGHDPLTNRRHSHDNCLEIIQVVSGEGNFMIRDTLYPFSHSAILLINGIDIHCSVPKVDSAYVRNKLILNSRRLEALADEIGSKDILQQLYSGDYSAKIDLPPETVERADALFSGIYRLTQENDPQKNFALYADILSILQFCADNIKTKQLMNRDSVSKTLSYINENITENLSLDRISSAVFADKYYLCKKFKKATGMTIAEYIRFRRLSLAKQKLQYTDMTISNISASCGFSGFSYFSKLFRETEGISPTEYRRKQENTADSRFSIKG